MNGLALCAGAGGLELGMHIAVPGYRAVGYVEREASSAASLVARMEASELGAAPVWDDLSTFDGRPWRGSVDIVTAGYPCQPFSSAGKRRGADDPRHLWPHVARVIDECRPDWVFLENVANHLRLGFRQVHDDLGRMGFRVAAGLFSAAEVGASHERKRLFILAVAEGVRCGTARQDQSGSDERADAEQSGAVVHAECPERRAREPRWNDGDGQASERKETAGRSGRSGPELADAACVGRQRSGITGKRDESEELPTGRHGSPVADAYGAGLASAQQPGQPGPTQCRDKAGAAVAELLGTYFPLFAPGPSSDLWPGIIDIAPALEPAVCGMADGVAHRVDRLRMCGNGVSPLAAAFAFRTLRAALFPPCGSAARDAASLVRW